LPENPVDEALLAAGRLANPHGQAVFLEKLHVLCNASQAVAHAQFKLPTRLATPNGGYRTIVSSVVRRAIHPCDDTGVAARSVASARSVVPFDWATELSTSAGGSTVRSVTEMMRSEPATSPYDDDCGAYCEVGSAMGCGTSCGSDIESVCDSGCDSEVAAGVDGAAFLS
jgi:hypothetical protein